MEFDSVIRKRHSTREFNKLRKASWKKVLEAIDAAIQGPFSGNHNTLKFIIVEDKKKIKELAKHSHQSWIIQSGPVVVVCSDDTYLEHMYGERGRIYNKQHAGAAIQSLILKLTDLGLSSCWVGAFTDEFVRNCLKIPSHIGVEAIIPVGYEKANHKTSKRKYKLENVLYWEEWDKDKRPTGFEEPKEEPRFIGEHKK